MPFETYDRPSVVAGAANDPRRALVDHHARPLLEQRRIGLEHVEASVEPVRSAHAPGAQLGVAPRVVPTRVLTFSFGLRPHLTARASRSLVDYVEEHAALLLGARALDHRAKRRRGASPSPDHAPVVIIGHGQLEHCGPALVDLPDADFLGMCDETLGQVLEQLLHEIAPR